jgi:hypothetical protein
MKSACRNQGVGLFRESWLVEVERRFVSVLLALAEGISKGGSEWIDAEIQWRPAPMFGETESEPGSRKAREGEGEDQEGH